MKTTTRPALACPRWLRLGTLACCLISGEILRAADGTAGTNDSSTTASFNMDSLDDKQKLSNGDRLSFRIVEDKDEPRPLTISDTGELEVPYIGRVSAADKTCQSLAKEIKARLEQKYYYKATVILGVDLFSKNRGKIYLVGQLRTSGPQEIPSDEALTLTKVILRAGGFTDFADKKHVKVTRKRAVGQEPETFTVDVSEIIEKGKMDKDLPLQSGDLVFVPARLVNF